MVRAEDGELVVAWNVFPPSEVPEAGKEGEDGVLCVLLELLEEALHERPLLQHPRHDLWALHVEEGGDEGDVEGTHAPAIDGRALLCEGGEALLGDIEAAVDGAGGCLAEANHGSQQAQGTLVDDGALRGDVVVQAALVLAEDGQDNVQACLLVVLLLEKVENRSQRVLFKVQREKL